MTNRSIDKEYKAWLSELKEKIKASQLKAGLKVNAEMLALYWELGKAISEKQEQSDWGDKIITQLAKDLTSEFVDIQGFSRSNLFNIRKFYQFYSRHLQLVQHGVGLLSSTVPDRTKELVQQDFGQFPAILGLIPWGHQIQVFTKCQSIEEALFYIQQTCTHNWKRTVLIYNIESGDYYRKGKAQTNFNIVLPKPQSELASEILKNPYNVGYLGLTEEVSERDLENAILAHIKKFLKELGPWFSFCGQQVHLQVSDKDYYIDLLFYHTRLHCYVVVELKVTEFEPEFAGKLEFYITAVDEQMKIPGDNPTIGLLLCKTADKVIVEYSLRTKTKPMGVAEYKHAIPNEWKNELPDVKLLEEELQKEIIIPQKPVDEKISKLKDIVQRLKVEPADLEKDNNVVTKVFHDIYRPLFEIVDKKLVEIKPLFKTCHIEGRYNDRSFGTYLLEVDLKARLLSGENIFSLGFEINLSTFMQAGTKAFSIWHRLDIQLDKHKYAIGPERNKTWFEKVYRKFPTEEELQEIGDRFVESIVDDIMNRTEMIL